MTTVTKESQLANMLRTCSEALKQVTAERDKLAAELKSLRDSVVELPDHPEPHTMKWLMCELDAIRDYGDRRAMAERERCALVCLATPPYPFRPSIEAAHAIRKGE